MESDSLPTLNQRLIQTGVRPSHASMLANGQRTPSLDLALDLEEALGIPAAAWRRGPDAVKAALAAADAAKSDGAGVAPSAPGCPA